MRQNKSDRFILRSYRRQPVKRRRRQTRASIAAAARMPRRMTTAPLISMGELKGVDTSLDVAPVLATTNTNGATFVVNLIQSGAAGWNRNGRKVNLQSLRLRGTIRQKSSPAAATNSVVANVLRCVVVWDRQPSGVLPAFDTIFGRTEQDGTLSTEFNDPLNFSNVDRFLVIRDKVIPCSTNAVLALGGGTENTVEKNYMLDEYIKLGKLHTTFSANSNPATIADISSGALYVIFRAETAQTLNRVEIVDSVARLRYLDM